METTRNNQWLNTGFEQDTYLLTWIEAFLIDRKAQGMSRGTLYYYTKKLALFSQFCETQAITQIPQITTNTIREYLFYLEETGHNPGGLHQGYRTLKTFLRWYESEAEPEGWKNPIRKVKAPKLAVEPLTPVDTETVKAMMSTCQRGTMVGERDNAILLALLDTGARASEFCAIALEDVDPIAGTILIRQGKGRKPRTVYLGAKSRRALRAYLKQRRDKNPALWVTEAGERMQYWTLREMVRRRAKLAGVPEPTLHAFRRFFALQMLRAGVDIFSLQKLMGHADLQVLRRYLAQTDGDTRAAHSKGSPVDNGL